MDAIRQWAFSICSAMVACGIAGLILPRGNLEKMFRLSVSVFFLCCLLSPVLLPKSALRFDLKEYTQEDIQERADAVTRVAEDQSLEAARENLEKIIGEKLGEMGIKYRVITINIITNGQSDQIVDTVEIVLDRQHEREHQQILSDLKETFDLDFRLGYEQLEEEGG